MLLIDHKDDTKWVRHTQTLCAKPVNSNLKQSKGCWSMTRDRWVSTEDMLVKASWIHMAVP